MVSKMVAGIESRLGKTTRTEGGSRGKKVRILIPERTNLEVFAGDRVKDKEGFVAWRDRLEMHLAMMWPGLSEDFEKIRDEKEPLTSEHFGRLVAQFGDKPCGTEEEGWETKAVGRHLYKVLMGHTTLDAKKTVVPEPRSATELRRIGC